ncbi:MAG: 2-C-methyl-D-erythritol 4-phosphate cytidylyltransferase [Verrucomicrobia bacterium]|nr:2-C-methyl-D-erythritol 4-phosphate cytidylyltransferase [Verrucomicrobiota bacterium]
MNTAAILLCGGSSKRMRGEVRDKVLVELKERPVFDYSVLAFEEFEDVTSYIVVYRDGVQRTELAERLQLLTQRRVLWVEGGEERQESVLNALEATPDDTDFVLIHDCARPLVQLLALQELLDAVLKDKSACLAHRVVDTIKQVSVNTTTLRQADLANLDRSRLWAMETPQAFSYKLILGCYRKLKEESIQVTDDTAAVIHYGYRVTLVENHFPNPKITLPEDLGLAELMLQQRDRKA